MTTTAGPLADVTDGGQLAMPDVDRAHDPLVEMRVGADLVIAAHNLKGNPTPTRWVIVAMDAGGTYLSTLATGRHGNALPDVWATAVAAARQLYPARATALTGEGSPQWVRS